jgi:hypothetical protein
MRLIESFAGWVRHFFSVTHDICLGPSRRMLSLPQPWRAIL